MTTISAKFGDLQHEFFIYESLMYFAKKYSGLLFHYPVMNGRISCSFSETDLHRRTEVEVIPREDWKKHGLTDEMVKIFLS